MLLHQPFCRLPKQPTDTAVLCLHGILGSPTHFVDFLPHIPDSAAVYSIRLKGHGGSISDFANASMSDWKRQTACIMRHLTAHYDHIVILAHSMGTLFAISLAQQYPKHVKQLFLLGVPTRVHLGWQVFREVAFTMYPHLFHPDPWLLAEANACSIRIEPQLWKYFRWIPNYLSLLREISRTRKLLPKLQTPCTAVQFAKDELVRTYSMHDLARAKSVKAFLLPDSGHFFYAPADKAEMLALFSAIFHS